MNLLTKDDLKRLIKDQQGWCVSIFMPTHGGVQESQKHRLRLRNLLEEAEERLLATALRVPDVRQLLAPAKALVSDGLFWREQSNGLAIFLSSEAFHHYRLPLNFEALVVVSDRFHMKPLLPLFVGDGSFYILALSQNKVRLLQGTRDSVSEVDLEKVPAGIAETLKYDVAEKELQFHSTPRAPRSKGQGSTIFHGHGGSPDHSKTNIRRYFSQVNKGLHELLANEQAPLVLAGVDYLHPIYREVNSYRHLVKEGITGNPDELKPEALHAQAWPIVQPLFQKAQEEAAAQYRQLAATGSEKASNGLAEIVRAATYGRVDSLFVALRTQQWGHFDPQRQEVDWHQTEKLGDEDLLDLAAIETLLHGGNVIALEPEKMPDIHPLAAIFRY